MAALRSPYAGQLQRFYPFSRLSGGPCVYLPAPPPVPGIQVLAVPGLYGPRLASFPATFIVGPPPPPPGPPLPPDA